MYRAHKYLLLIDNHKFSISAGDFIIYSRVIKYDSQEYEYSYPQRFDYYPLKFITIYVKVSF